MSKVRKSDQEQCIWNFGFELELNDRSLELYAPNRQERERWVTLFRILSEMNERLVSAAKINPFDFKEEEKLSKVQKTEEAKVDNRSKIEKS